MLFGGGGLLKYRQPDSILLNACSRRYVQAQMSFKNLSIYCLRGRLTYLIGCSGALSVPHIQCSAALVDGSHDTRPITIAVVKAHVQADLGVLLEGVGGGRADDVGVRLPDPVMVRGVGAVALP